MGEEKRCPRCGDDWPLTEEFYRRIKSCGRERWQSFCRACEAEWVAEKRAAARAAEE